MLKRDRLALCSWAQIISGTSIQLKRPNLTCDLKNSDLDDYKLCINRLLFFPYQTNAGYIASYTDQGR